MFLAIETATQQLGVAALEGERVLASYEVLADQPPHAVELPGAVQRVLQEAGGRLDQVEALILDIGPGSFTGLRIGVAFAKALAFPRNLPSFDSRSGRHPERSRGMPMVAVPSLDVLAAQLPMAPYLVCPILDAKRKNVYAALYRQERQGQPARDGDCFLGPVEDVLARIQGPAVFLGDGCALYETMIRERLGANAQFTTPDFWLPRVATLGRLGARRYAQGQRDDPATLTPLYLYPKDCSVRLPASPAGGPAGPGSSRAPETGLPAGPVCRTGRRASENR